MAMDLTFLEGWTLPPEHPAKVRERAKWQGFSIDYTMPHAEVIVLDDHRKQLEDLGHVAVVGFEKTA